MSDPSRPSRRSFGVPNALGIHDTGTESRQSRRISGTENQRNRPSFLSRLRSHDEEIGVKSPTLERPPIPSALRPGEADSTPLPTLSMIVLSITMLGEFLSANVAMPFLLFMVKGLLHPGFGEFEEESDIAFYTGVLVAAFFLTQFLTSLLWATVADKHGRRSVLTLSLFGSAVTVLVFGTCTSLRQAIAVRLLQGIFAGAVGVARGCVASVTDVTNEGRAYAIMGFCWGFGGVAGAIIGGLFERPAEKWPEVFGQVSLLVEYPYLLPCAVASTITLTGSFLSLFLGRDGGPREGAIRLPPEKPGNQTSAVPEEDEAIINEPLDEGPSSGWIGSMKKRFSRPSSGYFASRSPVAHSADMSPSTSVPLISSPRMDRQRTSRADGSAYGYSGSYRNRLDSSTIGRGSVRSTMRRRKSSNSHYDGHQSTYDGSDLNFTQRLLMANENAVTNIADLWVAAAMNVDNDADDQFDSDDAEIGSDEEQVRVGGDEYADAQDILGSTPTQHRLSTSRGIVRATSPSRVGQRSSVVTFASQQGTPHRSVSRTPALGSPLLEGTSSMRRSSSNAPSIFAHAGVRTPPAVLDAQLRAAEPSGEPLTPILERRRSANMSARANEVDAEDGTTEKPPSLTSQLPILVIIQYGLLALHSTTHDQVFLSYLVTDYQSGGLNLNPGHFSQLIALMCLFQIVYQFYLYPRPPRGRFSHMAMFRLGSLLFIPAYLTVILYRVFASPTDDGNFILMTALAISTAVRYCGNTFGYTAVSILLNYMTPPPAVGFANGVAQSIVSLARCFGPILGGYLWSASTQNDPSGYPLGFLACAGACALAVAHSFFIR
ncbi:hypothetical protein HYDPIDRAFT_95562 [Hydnomerulius pinastri MD-312]|uniref:Major facilitator superfamily MFS-1 n=1 Tax=Hydnomerulius pinastri MD-312 TaxID=994086 RepID=A0A0C9WCQ0_9AGAM|nr:hypothetical protein HYDPIDRAFT_95562 [Hydnomerulius pinastri MD-312]